MTAFQPDLSTAFAASSCIGAWAHDPQSDRFALSPALARLLMLSEDAAVDVPLAQALTRIDPEDAARLESMLRAADADGYPFETEFRTREAGSRWIRLMGRFARDPASGAAMSQGLAFDLTEGLVSGPVEWLAQRRANRLADHVIAMKGLVVGLRNPPLAQLIDVVAVEIGREVARHLRGDSHPVH
ncbi:hypothetical protein [Methylorubrum suomiense]|uniref:hypothetical protein n=1 Tax=Methylorubrum suomiense TaxID=144191 RepID=UPI0010F74B2A|nr:MULTISPECIES: hypothetical protein [Methylobacteriaceae]